MKRLLLALTFALALVPLVHSPARATTCTIPNTFTNGTTADANQVNANFSALQSCGNSIDYRNIGAAGIYASQIIPTTGAQATFSAAVGWTITTTSATVVPLTVNTAASPTADAFDVSINGTKNVWVASSGALNTLGAPVFGAAPTVSTFTTAGVVTNTTSGVLASSPTLPIAQGGTGATTLAGANIAVTNATNTFSAAQTFSSTIVTSGSPSLNSTGEFIAQAAGNNVISTAAGTTRVTADGASGPVSIGNTTNVSAYATFSTSGATIPNPMFVTNGGASPSLGLIRVGTAGSDTAAAIAFGNVTASETRISSSAATTVAGVAGQLLVIGTTSTNGLALDNAYDLGLSGSVFATSYNVSSRREWKTNIAPLRDPLALVMALPVYAWCYNGKGHTPNEHCKPGEHKHIGPMANHAPKIIAGPKRDHIDEGSLTGLTLAALRELVTRICTRMPDVCAKH